MGGNTRMDSWLNPKPFLDSIDDLEDALRRNDPHFIKRTAEAVIAARDEFFATARYAGAAMSQGRMTEATASQPHIPVRAARPA